MATTRDDVRKHASRESCWVIVDGSAYDVTSFLDSHPGGASAILKYAGKDATAAFKPIHAADTLDKHLKTEQKLGLVIDAQEEPSASPQDIVAARQKKVPLRSIISLLDFEVAASKLLDPKAFAFYRSGADDEFTFQWNRSSWKYVRFRPRILRPLPRGVDTSSSIFGIKSSVPFFICPAGGGKYAHPEGEIHMTRAAARQHVIQWVSNAAGCSQEELAEVRAPGQPIFWQIYAVKDLAVTEAEVRRAVELGYKAFCFTVDAIVMGNRERDARLSGQELMEEPTMDDDDTLTEGGISATRLSLHPGFDWLSVIKWLRSLTDLPIAIKGIQTWEDAKLCAEQPGIHPWLSNHGGRQLNGAPSAVDTLLEMRTHCPEVFSKCEVIVDGGVTRGTDVVKALCLGATAVGIGRPFLYALAYGEKGVTRAIKILKNEVETTMALLGVSRVEDFNTSYVDAMALRSSYGHFRARL
ncbi:Cytochrome b5 [Pleurostoma richardsiae]|uniref:Cytochrome b5 n=1 Tax=Pleurostoma richardsiae TaxID=41990 RepID=A0AA38S6Q9_9PEZI|nr:Cytochrome b5 [Pleurostoma richardsiae]